MGVAGEGEEERIVALQQVLAWQLELVERQGRDVYDSRLPLAWASPLVWAWVVRRGEVSTENISLLLVHDQRGTYIG